MSAPTPHADEHGVHHGPIRTPKQLVVAVVFAFVVPIIAIVLLVSYVAADKRSGAGSEAMSAQAIAERIRPVGAVEVKSVADGGTLKTGEQVYASACISCHESGTLNAPKFGDSVAWAPRIAQGYETLLTHALKGFKGMPAQGGGGNSDIEVGRAVVYMANKAGAKFEEPKAPAQPGATPTNGTTPPPVAATTAAAAATTAATTAAPAAGAAPAVYNQSCATCHDSGVAGAPKVGDKAAWAPRLAQGVDGLTASAIKGKGAMPPKGGTNASDADIKAAVTYMVSQAK